MFPYTQWRRIQHFTFFLMLVFLIPDRSGDEINNSSLEIFCWPWYFFNLLNQYRAVGVLRWFFKGMGRTACRHTEDLASRVETLELQKKRLTFDGKEAPSHRAAWSHSGTQIKTMRRLDAHLPEDTRIGYTDGGKNPPRVVLDICWMDLLCRTSGELVGDLRG